MKVSVRVTLHKGLKFRNADVAPDANTLDRDIGNVSSTKPNAARGHGRCRTDHELLST